MCGFEPSGAVALQAPHAQTVEDLVRLELAARFRLDVCLGHGASTVVYLAREPASNRHIVVKALPRAVEGRAEADDRFARAVEAVAGLEHPHLVPVFAHGRTESLYWYSMEHVRGRSLRTYLSTSEPLELKACLRIVSQVASALDHAHRRGIVHGALKPENVLIDAEGWVHVCDPLVALALRASAPPVLPGAMAVAVPRAEEVAASPHSPYDAPEDLCTTFSDQYALGALVFECLTGGPPPESGSAASERRRSGPAAAASLPAKRPDLPPHMTHAVRRALSRKPVDRFPGVLDFVAALETPALTALDARPSGQTSSAVLLQRDWEPPPRPESRKLIFVTVALGVVAAVSVLALALVPGGPLRSLLGKPQPAPFASLTDVPARPALPVDTGPSIAVPGARVPGAGAPRPSAPRPPGARVARPAPVARPVPAARSEPGRLFVNATPWGQLYLDGLLIGNTPKANLSLLPGSHTIRVVREGYEPFERVIRVAAGETVRLTDIVLAQRAP